MIIISIHFQESTCEEMEFIDGGGWTNVVSTVAYYGFVGGVAAVGGLAGTAVGGPIGGTIGSRAEFVVGSMLGGYVGDKIWDATR